MVIFGHLSGFCHFAKIGAIIIYMITPARLKPGDTIAIVSLSSGVLGEDFVKHEVKLMEERLKNVFYLNFVYMDNALKGEKFLLEHPEARAEDLKQAFLDKEVKAIWNALGGDDAFRTLPYLMNDDFRKIVQKNPKIFIGFSDTTNNHLMLHKMGLATYYAPALLSDIAELGPEIFPYSKDWLMELFNPTQNRILQPSPVWYKSRTNFGPDQLGVAREEQKETHGYIFSGKGTIEGNLLGGCLDSLYEMLKFPRYDDQKDIFTKYPIFPERAEWKNKILFTETSEERPAPEKHLKMLESLEECGVFNEIAALIYGKPQDEVYFDEYLENIKHFSDKYGFPFVYNLNFGHTTPRMILPYEQKMRIDFSNEKISLIGEMVK